MNKKSKILVLVDDLDKTLTQAGFDVQTQAEQDEVVIEAFEDHFDLIVNNYVMDGMKGLASVQSEELLRLLPSVKKSQFDSSNIPTGCGNPLWKG